MPVRLHRRQNGNESHNGEPHCHRTKLRPHPTTSGGSCEAFKGPVWNIAPSKTVDYTQWGSEDFVSPEEALAYVRTLTPP